MPKATNTLMAVFRDATSRLTMPDILAIAPDLRKNEVSMALCHLTKQGFLSREKVDRVSPRGRKEIWSYQFHADRQKEKSNEQNEN